METSSLRKDLQDNRLKIKNLTESKSILEIDIINARIQLQKTEEELSRVREKSEQVIVKANSQSVEVENMKAALKEEMRWV